MYGRNKNGKILNVLLGVIALFIIIFIIAWIVNKGANNSNYDEIFKANLETMQENAKNYFANELPEEIGDTTLISLEEMYTLDLSDKLTYGKTTCDETLSYISITKINATEFKVKSNLVCGSKSDNIVEKIQTNTIVEDENNNVIVDDNKDDVNLEVNDNKNNSNTNNNNSNTGSSNNTVNCFGPVCTFVEIETTCKTTYEYEFVKRNVKCTTGTYVNGTCVSEKTHTIDPTPQYSQEQLIVEDAKINNGKPYYRYVNPIVTGGDAYAYCKNGQLINGYCYQYADKIITEDKTCPAGYTREGNACYKYTDLIVEGTTSCPSGFTAKNNACYKYADLITKEESTCPSGFTKKNGYCYKYADLIAKDTSTYTCPNGYTKDGDKCLKVVSAVKKYTEWGNPDSIYSTTKKESTYEYELSKKVLVGTNKVGVTTTYTYAKYSRTSYYYCAQGTVSGSKCNIYTNLVKNESSETYCPSGYTRDGNTCYIKKNMTISEDSYCPSGYTRSGNTCYIKKDMIYDEESYCPSGYTRKGTTNICYMKEDLIVTKDEYCPAGYLDNGKNCYKRSNPSIGTTPKKYSCPSGANQSGSGENIKCYYIEISDSEYYCENAKATLKGNKCYYTKEAEFIGNTCNEGYELVGNICVKTTKEYTAPSWSNTEYVYSKETYLEGYQKTGVAKFVTTCTPVEEVHYK
ncbi:MAG: hypothetical protein IJO63_02995 [Bacilli bacterium]|nr:hypothetical protein [Bacilli bacterium]